MQALFTVAGLALATGILIVPNTFRDSVSRFSASMGRARTRDHRVGLIEPTSAKVATRLATPRRDQRRAISRHAGANPLRPPQPATWHSRATGGRHSDADITTRRCGRFRCPWIVVIGGSPKSGRARGRLAHNRNAGGQTVRRTVPLVGLAEIWRWALTWRCAL
jgi:hypothetical protein